MRRPSSFEPELFETYSTSEENRQWLSPEVEYEVLPLSAADSSLTHRVEPADGCRVKRNSQGSLIVRSASAITHVVIHVLDGEYNRAITNWRTGGGQRCFKPHYVISKGGEITQVVAEQHIPQHANSANDYSIGIEHDGYAIDSLSFTEDMYLASAALTRDICQYYGIPMDRDHIIGHDLVRDTNHGDPGGFWDWDYYLALVRWDGREPARKPIRIVIDYNSYNFWPTGNNWQEVRGRRDRPDPDQSKRPCIRQVAPCPPHSHGPMYFRARESSTTSDPAVFYAEIPVAGTYQVSAWWPILSDNNPDTTISVFIGNAHAPALSVRVNQSTTRRRTRFTPALPGTPIWFPLGTIPLRAGDTVQVEVSQRSTGRGWIVADAIRLFKP